MTVVTTETTSAIPEWIDIDLPVVDLSVRYFPTAFISLARWLRANRPQVLISALSAANTMAVIARRIARTPTVVIVTERNTPSVQRKDARGLRRRYLTPWLMRRTYPRADAVVGVSTGVADDVATFVGIERAAVTMIPNPVADEALANRCTASLDDLWESQLADQKLVLSVGRLEAHKDHTTLIDAFALVAKRLPDVMLIIIGDGPLRARIEEHVQTHGLVDRVVLTGFQPNPAAWMARAEVVALASRYEGLPTVLIEALACGARVVSTDCPSGPREVLDGGRWGHLVPVGDHAALAEALAEALALGRWASPPAEALAPYRPDVVLDQWQALLSALTHNGGPTTR